MRGTVTVKTEVEYRAWRAPNFAQQEMPPALRQDGIKELPSIPIGSLSEAALYGLAQAWINELFAKSDYPPPALAKGHPS